MSKAGLPMLVFSQRRYLEPGFASGKTVIPERLLFVCGFPFEGMQLGRLRLADSAKSMDHLERTIPLSLASVSALSLS